MPARVRLQQGAGSLGVREEECSTQGERSRHSVGADTLVRSLAPLSPCLLTGSARRPSSVPWKWQESPRPW